MYRFLAALVLALVPVSAVAQQDVVAVVVIEGKGFGHGVGMAQEGAFWMGAAGASTEQIFGQFYPGAGLGRARGPVRVPVLDAGAAPTSTVLTFAEGGEVRENGTGAAAPGFPVRVPAGGQVRIVFDGRYRVEPLFGGPLSAPRSGERVELAAARRPQIPTLPPPPTTTTSTTSPPAEPGPTTTTSPPATTPTPTSPPPTTSTSTTTAPPATTSPPPPPATPPGQPQTGASVPSTARPLVAVPSGNGTVELPVRQRRYRGVIEATAAAGSLRFVNTVDLETYLKGMGEVRDPTWPPAALRAQAIAARTYAMRAMAVGGEVCDTQRCQVYLGAQAEYAAMNKAVDDSREQVLVFERALISAVYSANGGGFSASREEGFGVTDGSIPYLRAAPYLTKDPLPWTVTVSLRDVGARLGYGGDVTDVRVARAGPSGRAIEVVLDGSAGPKSVTGLNFDASLGLRSTLFTLRVEAGVAPPPPPPSEEMVLQAPPEDAAASAAADIAGLDDVATPTPARPFDDAAAAERGRPDGRNGVPEEAILFATWGLLALVGAAVVRVRPWGASPSTPRPSPSAPPSADDSP